MKKLRSSSSHPEGGQGEEWDLSGSKGKSLHQASPPLGGSMSSFSPSFIPCPCNPQMLCIWNFFLGFGSWVSTPQCLQECTHGLPGRFFPQKVQTLQWYSWWMGSQNLRVQCFPWVNSRVTGSGQSTPICIIIINYSLYFLSSYKLPGIVVGFPGGSVVKNLLPMQEMQVWAWGQ